MAAGEEGLHQLEAELAAKAGAYRAAAEKLTGQRREAARRLDHAVATELAPLKLDAARFRTLVEPLDESQWTARGADRVEFEISTNPGAPFAPLIKIASGGELSRFILALKVALAQEGGADTMIFRSDEHTSELQSLMRISYAVFCLKKKKQNTTPKE